MESFSLSGSAAVILSTLCFEIYKKIVALKVFKEHGINIKVCRTLFRIFWTVF